LYTKKPPFEPCPRRFALADATLDKLAELTLSILSSLVVCLAEEEKRRLETWDKTVFQRGIKDVMKNVCEDTKLGAVQVDA
jgi:hypothetical protein